jgi:hypothetical protein
MIMRKELNGRNIYPNLVEKRLVRYLNVFYIIITIEMVNPICEILITNRIN